VSNLQIPQKRKSLSKEFSPKESLQLQARKRSKREEALTLTLRGKLKRLLSLRYLKNLNK
jgi:hypothetical protein